MDIEKAKQKAIERLKTSAYLSEADATSLVQAALDAASEEALETIVGDGPLPTTLAAVRANRLHFIWLRAQRALKQREIQVLLRVTPSAAASLMGSIQATFAEALRPSLVKLMNDDVTVTKSGDSAKRLTYTLRFTEPAAFGVAADDVRRLPSECLEGLNRSRLTIEICREMTVDKKKIDTLKYLAIGKKP